MRGRGCWPTRTGLGKAKEHLFPLSSAPVALNRSGRTQELIQPSQSRPSSCFMDSRVGRRTLGILGEPLPSSHCYLLFQVTPVIQAVSALTSEETGLLNQFFRPRLSPNCIGVYWLSSLPEQQSANF